MNILLRPSYRRYQSCLSLSWKYHLIIRRAYASISQVTKYGTDTPARVRNIGIIAHIDAGKTTTTERMLYYSGFTRRIGDVDDGSTVTDFLPAERERGITIQSAAVTFSWPPSATESPPSRDDSNLFRSSIPHTINLIDTPGHADFTFEVLRSLRILDGAVCILDGVAGVEAQTEKVWQQANAYSIPRIIFVNKLDREGAAFERTVREIGSRLRGQPVLCQIPWWEGGKGKFIGVGDVIGLRGLKWETGGDGRTIKVASMNELESEEPSLAEEIKKARIALVESLSEYDEQMVDKFLEGDEDHLSISSLDIVKSLRRCISKGDGIVVPVFAGASFKNIGVQPLLDSIVDLLPEPTERPDSRYKADTGQGVLADLISSSVTVKPQQTSAKKSRSQRRTTKTDLYDPEKFEACALAFKVVNDARRGILVYIRIYSGKLLRGAMLWNSSLQISEKIPRLLQIQASETIEVDELDAGQIGVIPGLKYTRTGDTLVCVTGQNPSLAPPQPLKSLQLQPIPVPPPVFFASIEPSSLREEKHLQDSLSILLREDPSLHLATDDDSGQTLLSGMGELHLEIARDHLLNDLKAKAHVGKIEIGYRESLIGGAHSELRHSYEQEISNKSSKASCAVKIAVLDDSRPLEGQWLQDGNQISIQVLQQEGSASILDFDPVPHLRAGVLAALARGPSYNLAVHGLEVSIEVSSSDLHAGETTPAALTAVARQATRKAIVSAVADYGSALVEPIMHVSILVDEASLGAVMHDISSARGGQVESLDGEDHIGESGQPNTSLRRIDIGKIYTPRDPFTSYSDAGDGEGQGITRTIIASVPLREMVGYLGKLRSLSKGRGTFVMQFEKFERVSGAREKRILEDRRGS